MDSNMRSSNHQSLTLTVEVEESKFEKYNADVAMDENETEVK